MALPVEAGVEVGASADFEVEGDESDVPEELDEPDEPDESPDVAAGVSEDDAVPRLSLR